MRMVITYANAANVKNTFMVINADHCVKNVLINTMRPKIGHNARYCFAGAGIELLMLGTKAKLLTKG